MSANSERCEPGIVEALRVARKGKARGENDCSSTGKPADAYEQTRCDNQHPDGQDQC